MLPSHDERSMRRCELVTLLFSAGVGWWLAQLAIENGRPIGVMMTIHAGNSEA
jgi:hypothetical protein